MCVILFLSVVYKFYYSLTCLLKLETIVDLQGLYEIVYCVMNSYDSDYYYLLYVIKP